MFDEPVKVVHGEFEIGSQYHFHLEPLTCIVKPLEDDQYRVDVTTQNVFLIQRTMAKAMGVPQNSLDIKVRRLGGGFGGKISNPNQVAAATGIAVLKVRL